MIHTELLSSRFSMDDLSSFKMDNPETFRERNLVLEKITSGAYQLFDRICPICANNEFTKISERDRYGFPIPTVVCKSCGLVQLNPLPRCEDYVDFYSNHYRRLYIADLVGSPEFFFREEIDRGKKILRYIIKQTKLGSDALILEIGCGAGGILYIFKQHGFRIIGMDYGSENLAYGMVKGLDLRLGSIFDLHTDLKPDLIIYSHVLEHIYDPISELNKVQKLLADDGYLYIEVPGILYTRKNVFQGDFLSTFHVAHVFSFNLKTLQNLLLKTGFNLLIGDESVRSIFVKNTFKTNQYHIIINYMRRTEKYRKYYKFLFRVKIISIGYINICRKHMITFLKRVRLYERLKHAYYKK